MSDVRLTRSGRSDNVLTTPTRYSRRTCNFGAAKNCPFLVRHERLDGLYMVDLLCDVELQSFYESLGMRPATGMSIRRFELQSGARPTRAR